MLFLIFSFLWTDLPIYFYHNGIQQQQCSFSCPTYPVPFSNRNITCHFFPFFFFLFSFSFFLFFSFLFFQQPLHRPFPDIIKTAARISSKTAQSTVKYSLYHTIFRLLPSDEDIRCSLLCITSNTWTGITMNKWETYTRMHEDCHSNVQIHTCEGYAVL
jgi:hypothetical protein